jgi:spore coat protein YsxE
MVHELKSVLSHYRLFTPVLKQFGNVTKVYTGNGIYALKETRMSDDHVRGLESLKDSYYNGIPLVLTSSGKKYYKTNDRVYYLTPWLKERRISRVDKLKVLLEEVATIHKKTMQEVPFQEAWKTNYQLQLERTIIGQQALLEQYIGTAEQEVYMSPFHYAFCSAFPYWMKTINQYKAYLERWKELVYQEKNVRLVLNHGKLKREHFICTTTENHFLNLENSHWNGPLFDLLSLFTSEGIDGYSAEVLAVYERIFPLSDSEKLMLALHLLTLQPIYDTVKRYADQAFESELDAVRQLQRSQVEVEKKKHFVEEIMENIEKQSHM